MNQTLPGKYAAYEEEHMMAGSHNSMKVFLANQYLFSSKDYWKYLRGAYTHQSKEPFPVLISKGLFLSYRKGKSCLMNRKEKVKLKELPEVFTIYRGMSIDELNHGMFGISWTIDYKVAELFCKIKYPGEKEKRIHSLTINKKDVIALFLDRNESEIIYITNLSTN